MVQSLPLFFTYKVQGECHVAAEVLVVFFVVSMSVSVVLENVAMTTGEGPHWDERNNCLIHVDITAGDVHKWDAKTNTDTKVHLGEFICWVVYLIAGSVLRVDVEMVKCQSSRVH